jgi:protease IV
MPLDADQIVDRRRLRRRLSFWRVLAFVLAAAALVTGLAATGTSLFETRTAHVARVSLPSVITDSRDQIELLRRISESGSARALIVVIDSPGGTTAGSEAIFEAIRKVGAEKPVVAQLGTIATSGGYAAAIAADHIVSRRNTITGSIGVLVQWAEVTELLESIGVQMQSIKSDPLKAAPSPFEPASEEARAVVRALVEDSHDWFVDLVAERRGLEPNTARQLSDGRIMTGRQALEAGLVDALGGEDEARNWLAESHNINRDLPVREWRASSSLGTGVVGSAAAWIARATGLEPLARAIERSWALGGAGLDGLVSVWHPQLFEE